MVISLPFFWGYLPVLTNARRRAAFDVLARTVVTVAPPEAETASSATDRYSEPRRYVDLARRGGGSQ